MIADAREPAARPAPTGRQRRVYDWICAYWAANGRPPTYREMMAGLEISSPNGVVCHLKALAAKGWLEWSGRDSRNVWPAGLRKRIAAAVVDLYGPGAGTLGSAGKEGSNAVC